MIIPCHRTFDPGRPMRSSPAAKMQASQLLIGHFAGPDGHGIAFPDACLKEPIVLRPTGGAGGFVPARQTVGVKSNVERDVVCKTIGTNDYVASGHGSAKRHGIDGTAAPMLPAAATPASR